MKRLILIVLAVLIVVPAAVFGKDAFDLYRFYGAMRALAATNNPREPNIAESCFMCHGPQGQSRNKLYASLTGQAAAYLTARLESYAQGRHKNPAMSSIAVNLTDKEIRWLGDYFAKLPAVQNEPPEPLPGLLSQGRALVAGKGCAACHGEDLMGKDAVPRLAGQGEGYLISQFNAYRDGTRTDPVMGPVAKSLSDTEVKALAHYIAGRVPSRSGADTKK